MMLRVPAHSLAAAAVVAAALAFGGCTDNDARTGTDSSGGTPATTGDRPREGYPQREVEKFVTSCSAQPGASDAYCRCAIGQIEARLPFEQFEAATRAIANEKPASRAAERAIQLAIRTCRKRAARSGAPPKRR